MNDILQSLMFPEEGICTESDLYYRGEGFQYNNSEIKLAKSGYISTNSYFNAFSIGKWKKYTEIDALSLEINSDGFFNLQIVYQCENGNERMLSETIINGSREQQHHIKVDIEDLPEEITGILFVNIHAMEEIVIESDFLHFIYKKHSYELTEVDLALGICTYKREAAIRSNIALLQNKLFKENNPLHHQLEIFITDNGQSLEVGEFESDKIHIFKNHNTGGAGGFTRCMIEAVYNSPDKEFTHMILMDDDVIYDPDILKRLYVFLQFLKEEFRSMLVGGALLDIEKPFCQLENSGYWSNRKSIRNNAYLNLKKVKNVIYNEREKRSNWNGWWFCVIPTKLIRQYKLPLPIFIHNDDVEYGVRIGKPIITMNGICVWHHNALGFTSNTNAYFDTRNYLILNAIHNKSFNRNKVKKQLIIFFLYNIVRYQYTEIKVIQQAVKDFYSGFDVFKNQEIDLILKDIKKLNPEKWLPINQTSFQPIDISKGKGKLSKNSLCTIFLSLINWILPAIFSEKMTLISSPHINTFLTKKIFRYDEDSGKGFYLVKSYSCLWESLGILRQILMSTARHEKVVAEWKSRINEVNSLSYWSQYLGLDKTNIPDDDITE